MHTFMNKLRSGLGKGSLLRDDRGLSTVEYVIILVLIAAAAIFSWQTFGGKVRAKIDAANTEMDKVQVDAKPSK
ncbi:MAG: Flp family type IVb pilin [Polyangiaceae bacterium]